MSDMSMAQNGQAPPEMPDGSAGVEAMLRAIQALTEKAIMDMSAAEAKDRAAAVLSFAQAIVVLDPTRAAGGVPLEHEVAMEQVRQDGQHRLEMARQAAAAPTPAKRKSVTVRRDAHGRMAGAEVSEG